MNTQNNQQKPSGPAPGAGKTTVGDAVAAAPREAPKALPVARGRLNHAQEVCTRHRLVLEMPEQYAALVKGDREVWKFIGPRVQSGDTIEVVDDRSAFFALLYARLVISTAAGGLAHIDVVELLHKPLGAAEEMLAPTGAWAIMYRGPYAKWCLIRPDGTICRDCMLTRDEAQVMLNQQTAARRSTVEVHF